MFHVLRGQRGRADPVTRCSPQSAVQPQPIDAHRERVARLHPFHVEGSRERITMPLRPPDALIIPPGGVHGSGDHVVSGPDPRQHGVFRRERVVVPLVRHAVHGGLGHSERRSYGEKKRAHACESHRVSSIPCGATGDDRSAVRAASCARSCPRSTRSTSNGLPAESVPAGVGAAADRQERRRRTPQRAGVRATRKPTSSRR